MLSYRNFPRLPTYDFAHAKTKNSILYFSILEFDNDFGINFHDFHSLLIHQVLKLTKIPEYSLPIS